jgi:aspartate-semialdehyde dehydrogenase
MRIAVIGATGMVGQTMLNVLDEHALAFDALFLAASASSAGKIIRFREKPIEVIKIEQALALHPDIALFSAGSEVSKQWAPIFASKGIWVIDNSSAWRMRADVPLVVPEINADAIKAGNYLIANPNCSTIQMVMALAPIHKEYKVKRLVISTYQSVTGSGYKGVSQLQGEAAGEQVTDPAYPHPIHLNLIPHGGAFYSDGYTTEERKLELETKKILNAHNIAITATVVRVPVYGGHSMTVNIETEIAFDLKEVRALLSASPGINLFDDPFSAKYPTPLFAQGKDDVFVGRLRRDSSVQNGMNMWVVSDNLRKGAATNAVQIATYLADNNFISS